MVMALQSITKDDHERAKFMSRRKFETDMASNLLTAEKRGQLQGQAEERRRIAKNLKTTGMPVETIARLTELTITEITEL
jgi:predicted transposase/invertase (TIGR01784 family)